ncbi:hypothetical protein NDN08_000657 [Rhodosorus marinus]|uniref:Glutaredoxin domain-containing protein n=1 Tax=Rhodosorus marinus TaxID=101924 RepID=A0AAV8UNK5_9RHOD|nr:hypothetical protein NDN08_000657 [Rhodosorus marinus]
MAFLTSFVPRAVRTGLLGDGVCHRVVQSKATVGRFHVRMQSASTESEDKFVADALKSDKVVVFATTTCPYCAQVKDLFNSLNLPFKSYNLNTMDDGAYIRQSLLRSTSQRTVPNVFIGGEHVGGCDDTIAALESGNLQKLLSKVGLAI